MILLPVLNESRYIESALNAVKYQSYSNWILVARDNASEDNTLEILRKHAEFDSRIIVLESNKRVSGISNWLSVYDFASSNFEFDYICYLGGDDLWLGSDYLESLLNYFRSSSLRTISVPSILLKNEILGLESMIKIDIRGDSPNDRMLNYVRDWNHVNLIYGLYESKYFSEKIRGPVTRLSDYKTTDWWWGIGVVFDQEVQSSKDAVYFKRINKDVVTQSSLKLAFDNLYSALFFFYEHLYKQRSRLKTLTIYEILLLTNYSTTRWLFLVYSASKHLLKSLFLQTRKK